MKMIFLCSDLDRTLIPNGSEPETPFARPLLNRLVEKQQVRLTYVSGRDKELIQSAISDYQLPQPVFVISDVGSMLYRIDGKQWTLIEGWHDQISRNWKGYKNSDIADLLDSVKSPGFELQPEANQNKFKLSYFTESGDQGRSLKNTIAEALEQKGIQANLIWSKDESEDRGLLDILPRDAGKVSAIRFLMKQEAVADLETVFAGDSGNDLDALTSGLQSILVKNADDDVRCEAVEKTEEKGCSSKLYLAEGGLCSLNGNYSAGVIEGLMYFYPNLKPWVQCEIEHHFTPIFPPIT